MTDLERELVMNRRWRWLAGMQLFGYPGCLFTPVLLGDSTSRGAYVVMDGQVICLEGDQIQRAGGYPGIQHSASRGVLLDMLREDSKDPYVCPKWGFRPPSDPGGDRWWGLNVDYLGDFRAATESEVIGIALLATWARMDEVQP